MRDVEAQRKAFVSETARQVVDVVAPEELVLFEPLAARFVRAGELPHEQRYSDGIIGSGWDSAVVLISPVVLTLANALYNRLLDNVSDEVLKRGGRGLRRAWRGLRHADRAAQAAKGPEDLAEARDGLAADTGLRDQLLLQARELGVPEEKAAALVDVLLSAAKATLPGSPGPSAGDDTGAA
ncbi:hypothetical protein [Streptacidiphilus neutrinimicus]|uniref:hypothetical protein n=1 Tax=Streptacidiphilus neutrinimicus TaxID=105420 RepID=UPI0005A84BBC|nr:hypothetical protein [Streptacidiphilus neutrinimicus]